MKARQAIRSYYVLPCCLLLLNLCVEVVSYKARALNDNLLIVLCVMGMVVFGSSLIAYLVSPGIEWLIDHLYKGSRKGGGGLGELVFLLALGALIFWLYYRVYIIGAWSILPASWKNPPVVHH